MICLKKLCANRVDFLWCELGHPLLGCSCAEYGGLLLQVLIEQFCVWHYLQGSFGVVVCDVVWKCEVWFFVYGHYDWVVVDYVGRVSQ